MTNLETFLSLMQAQGYTRTEVIHWLSRTLGPAEATFWGIWKHVKVPQAIERYCGVLNSDNWRINMKTLEVRQGSDKWLRLRGKYGHTASEASVIMSCSSKISRQELLRMKAACSEKEFSRWVQENLLDKGHEIEALARPMAEEFIGDGLYPVVGVSDDDYLLASFDGLTMLEDIVWECKMWSEPKAQAVRDGRVPDEDAWQVIQQMIVSGADKAVYTLSDGTPERTLHVWRELGEGEEKALRLGWQQFDEDLANYQHVEVTPAPEGRAPETLPALHVEVTGMVTKSNLVEFKETALALIGTVNRDLQTDNDFADAKQAIKWCKEVETRLKAAKQHALSQTASIDELFRTIDSIDGEYRGLRLDLTKLVKTREESIRIDIVKRAKEALKQHIDVLNNGMGGSYIPEVQADFFAAMKNKRTIQTIRDAADAELARAKIQVQDIFELVNRNRFIMNSVPDEYIGLFPDMKVLLLKSSEDVEATIKARIADHKAAEERRLEAERERAEEEAKARREMQVAAEVVEQAAMPLPPMNQSPDQRPGQ